MSYGKKILLIGDTFKTREFKEALEKMGSLTATAPDITKALELVTANPLFDGIVFVVPVYWENVSEFISKIKQNQNLIHIPIIYLGDFIEASDQVVLKQQGVHTLTLGPVPPQEAVRYILSLIK